MEYQDRQIKTAGNSGLALWGLTCFVETFVQDSTFVLRMNSSAKNPPQRQAENRCKQPLKTQTLKTEEHEFGIRT